VILNADMGFDDCVAKPHCCMQPHTRTLTGEAAATHMGPAALSSSHAPFCFTVQQRTCFSAATSFESGCMLLAHHHEPAPAAFSCMPVFLALIFAASHSRTHQQQTSVTVLTVRSAALADCTQIPDVQPNGVRGAAARAPVHRGRRGEEGRATRM
jgi:hypothetical protein